MDAHRRSSTWTGLAIALAVVAGGCGGVPAEPVAAGAATAASARPAESPAAESPAAVSPSTSRSTSAPRPAVPTPAPVSTATSTPRSVPSAASTPGADGRIPAWATGRDWESLPGAGRAVALTFDAGANADAVPSILATLATERVPATFFLTGDWVRRYPDAARRIAAAGYLIGNHSLSHPAFTALAAVELQRQLSETERLILAVTGRSSKPLFRFPLGDRDDATIEAVNRAGYVPVRWTLDTVGWKGTSGGMTTDAVLARVLPHVRPGAIVLMHVGSHPTDGSMLDAAALPTMIQRIRAAGFGFTDLSSFAAMP